MGKTMGKICRSALMAATAMLVLGGVPATATAGTARSLFSEPGTALYTAQDASGRVTVTVFKNTSSNFQEVWTDQEITVGDSAMVAIGGGGAAVDQPAGAMLTASYPNETLTGWRVSAKDHITQQSYKLTTYVIGLKIAGMTRDQLKNYLVVSPPGSAYGHTPTGSQHLDSNTDVMLGGAFKIDWSGWGQLATASYPSGPVEWSASSKDHLVDSQGTVTAWAIGIKRNLPVGQIDRYVTPAVNSQQAPHPIASAPIQPGYVMTGGGGWVHYNGAGNMLWKLEPSIDNSGFQSFTAAAKDHNVPDPSVISAYAIGIRLI
jgi:hypothetical protein